MRLLTNLAAAIFILLALPAAANAASASCGFLNGQYDIAGRTVIGEARYAGQTFQISASFNRDCTITFSEAGKNPRSGTWLQKNENMAIKLGDADFLGKVGADGAISGQLATHDDKVGTFSFKAPDGPVARAPAAGAAASGACGKGDSAHPYVAGAVYDGSLMWFGDEPEDLTLTFNADCSVGYEYKDGSVGSAVWKQDGKAIHLDVNNGYATYDGELDADQQFSGGLENTKGKSGIFAFDRK